MSNFYVYCPLSNNQRGSLWRERTGQGRYAA